MSDRTISRFRIAGTLAIGLALPMLTLAAAPAGFTDPSMNSFHPGTVISSSAVNANFNELAWRSTVAQHEVSVDCATQSITDVVPLLSLDAANTQYGMPHGRLTINISGQCTENLLIGDDVSITLQGVDGTTPTITAADNAIPVIQIIGGSLIRINDLKVVGGSDGITATEGSTLKLSNVELAGLGAGVSQGFGLEVNQTSAVTLGGSILVHDYAMGIHVNGASNLQTDADTIVDLVDLGFGIGIGRASGGYIGNNSQLTVVRGADIGIFVNKGGSLHTDDGVTVTVTDSGGDGVAVYDASTLHTDYATWFVSGSGGSGIKVSGGGALKAIGGAITSTGNANHGLAIEHGASGRLGGSAGGAYTFTGNLNVGIKIGDTSSLSLFGGTLLVQDNDGSNQIKVEGGSHLSTSGRVDILGTELANSQQGLSVTAGSSFRHNDNAPLTISGFENPIYGRGAVFSIHGTVAAPVTITGWGSRGIKLWGSEFRLSGKATIESPNGTAIDLKDSSVSLFEGGDDSFATIQNSQYGVHLSRGSSLEAVRTVIASDSRSVRIYTGSGASLTNAVLTPTDGNSVSVDTGWLTLDSGEEPAGVFGQTVINGSIALYNGASMEASSEGYDSVKVTGLISVDRNAVANLWGVEAAADSVTCSGGALAGWSDEGITGLTSPLSASCVP